MRCTAYAIMKCKLLLSLLIILTIQCVQSEDSAHWVVKGDPTDTTTRAKPDECVSDTNSYGSTYNSYGNNIGASCCDSAGTTAYTPTDCTASVSVTFSEAETICNDAGYRLCTQAEMNGAISGGGLGCNFDFYHIWTSDECSLSDDGPTITVYVEETNTCDGEPTYYEWQKVVSCRETLSDSNDESIFTFYADWDDDDVRESIVANAASIKFAPTDDMNNEDYVVFAKENTDPDWPVYYLRSDEDVSTSSSKWCGTDTALQRVGISSSYNYGYDLGRLIYGERYPSSSDEIQIYLDDNNCAWDWGTSVGKDIDVYIGYSVDSGIDITITSCSNWDYASTSNTLQMLLKGSLGSTKFFYVNENEALPTNGGSTTFSLQMDDLGANIGDLYSVMLSMDDTDGFCLAGVSVSYFNIDGLTDVNVEFESDYFGNGVILRRSCDYSFEYVSSDIPLLQCFETFDFNAYAKRGIFEADIHTCIGDDSGMSVENMGGNLYAVFMGKDSTESGNSYHSTSITYLDHLDAELEYLWAPNTNIIFEFNSEQYMDNVTLIAVGNIHEEDTLCIDAINVNDNAAIYLSNYYIGNTADADSTLLTAFFQYPVCATTVVGMTVDYDSEAANMINGASTISGLQCKNNNKLISSTCSIAQSFTMSKTTSYSISNEDSSTNEYSWGSATSIMKGITESESSTVTNDFSFGFEESITLGVSGGLFVEASLEVGLSANQQWTRSEANSQATDETVESTTEQNEGNTESTTQTSSYESTFESTTETTIECAAEIKVPPLHSVTYSMVFNTFNTTIHTWTDLKLTLCSAFFNDIGEDDDSHVVYIDNIPGVIAHKETTSCTVEFEPSEYLRNALSCSDAQRLAVSMSATYVPRCQSADPTYYDGCQCDVGAGSCWCVDDEGNLDGNAMSLNGVSWEIACTGADYLNCDTELNAGVNVFVKPDVIDEHYDFGKYYDNGLLLLVSAIVISVFFCGYYIYRQLKNLNAKIDKHSKSYQY